LTGKDGDRCERRHDRALRGSGLENDLTLVKWIGYTMPLLECKVLII
jgi:hypothetical protein